jgi:hypothetical protein
VVKGVIGVLELTPQRKTLMGWFDWIWKYKFDNEKQTLIDIRTHTIDWYNQVTEPLKPILKAVEFQQTNMNVQDYAGIAMEVYDMRISSNSGERLGNSLESMGDRGFPFFTSPQQIQSLANEFQNRGNFVKDLAIGLYAWEGMSQAGRDNVKQNLVAGWANFGAAKDVLISEINRQIKKLG